MIKGYLKYFVLKFLDEADTKGYDLMNRLEAATGKRPSPGSIYPLLKDLEESGFITSREEGKSKIYTITKQGKEILKTFKKQKECMFERLNKSMSALVQLS
ncbi:TPA: PadR family transcriptional regulator [Candidatus Woesearchaeota archaeon]|nr:PadR family transcriptional regulator [Candidatus Woesearchaeota archaeon]